MSEQTPQMTSRRPYLLRGLYEWILDNQCSPFLLVDCTLEGVQVPAQHIEDGRIVLNLTPSAIRGFEIADDGVYFSARFSGTPMNIIVPINAVLAIYARENGEGMVFGPSISAEVAELDEPDTENDQKKAALHTVDSESKKERTAGKKPAVGLKSVKSGAADKAKESGQKESGDGSDDEPPAGPPKGGSRPALRVVK